MSYCSLCGRDHPQTSSAVCPAPIQTVTSGPPLVIRIPIELFARVVWDNYEPRCGMPSFCESERDPWKGGEGTGWEELTEEDRQWWIQLFTDCISCEADPGGDNVDPARVGEIALILKPEVVPIATAEEIELLREQANTLIYSFEISGVPDRKQPLQWHEGQKLHALADRLERIGAMTGAEVAR